MHKPLSTTPDLPDPVYNMVWTCSAAFFQKPPTKPFNEAGNMLVKILQEYKDSSDPAVIYALQRCALLYIENLLSLPKITRFHSRVVDHLFELAMKKEILADITTDEHDRHVLASACLLRIQLAKTVAHAHTYNVVDILNTWSSAPVNDNVKYSLPTAVATLHGPACWSLYHDATVDDIQLIQLLYKEKIPLTKEFSKESMLAAIELPEVLTC